MSLWVILKPLNFQVHTHFQEAGHLVHRTSLEGCEEGGLRVTPDRPLVARMYITLLTHSPVCYMDRAHNPLRFPMASIHHRWACQFPVHGASQGHWTYCRITVAVMGTAPDTLHTLSTPPPPRRPPSGRPGTATGQSARERSVDVLFIQQNEDVVLKYKIYHYICWSNERSASFPLKPEMESQCFLEFSVLL